MKKKILFVCSANIHRSPTAELMLKEDPRYEAKSAGIYSLDKPVTKELVKWADVIFVMDEQNEGHKTHLLMNFPAIKDLKKKIIVLGIPDLYLFGSEELIKLLINKLKRHLK